MTKTELCRAIAEKLEPFDGYMFTQDRHADSSCVFWWSPQRWWTLHFRSDDWSGIDFFTSEDASARLLEAMPETDLSKQVSLNPSKWRCDPFGNNEIGTSAWHEDRKTAIVLATLKWLGIEGEIDDQ